MKVTLVTRQVLLLSIHNTFANSLMFLDFLKQNSVK